VSAALGETKLRSPDQYELSKIGETKLRSPDQYELSKIVGARSGAAADAAPAPGQARLCAISRPGLPRSASQPCLHAAETSHAQPE